MKSFVLCFLTINILRVDCGLLGQVLTPVTEKVQNNELLDEHARKENETEKKGLVSNLVDGLDAGLGTVVDPLKNLLNQGKKNKVDKDNTQKTGELPKNDTKVDDIKKPDVEDDENTQKTGELPKNDTTADDIKKPDVKDANLKDVSNNSHDKNATKDANKEQEPVKDNLNSTTPTTDIKANTTGIPTIKPENEDVNVTRRINFDGSQCPTGTARADDDTCKEVA